MELRRNEGPGGKREITEKTRRPTASSGTIPTCVAMSSCHLHKNNCEMESLNPQQMYKSGIPGYRRVWFRHEEDSPLQIQMWQEVRWQNSWWVLKRKRNRTMFVVWRGRLEMRLQLYWCVLKGSKCGDNIRGIMINGSSLLMKQSFYQVGASELPREFTEYDLLGYKILLELTHALYQDNNPETGVYKDEDHEKIDVLAGLFNGLALRSGEGLKKIDDGKNIDHVFWDGSNELVNRLRPLVSLRKWLEITRTPTRLYPSSKNLRRRATYDESIGNRPRTACGRQAQLPPSQGYDLRDERPVSSRPRTLRDVFFMPGPCVLYGDNTLNQIQRCARQHEFRTSLTISNNTTEVNVGLVRCERNLELAPRMSRVASSNIIGSPFKVIFRRVSDEKTARQSGALRVEAIPLYKRRSASTLALRRFLPHSSHTYSSQADRIKRERWRTRGASSALSCVTGRVSVTPKLSQRRAAKQSESKCQYASSTSMGAISAWYASTKVMRVWNQCIEEGRTQRRAGSGPHSVITERDDYHIVRMAVTDRTASCTVMA
ncbi:hypothetical protein PR048_028077 [Dryococelus australis]|uniref:Uncharacterized protein n=1 Tax=Dryococelus australis TaxID=614101 RepID=A0ABQ9GI93_9NEOP|nr:hypothetical protein PR048_028077 [Dryococelus australis]